MPGAGTQEVILEVFDNSATDPENPPDALAQSVEAVEVRVWHLRQPRCVINLAEIEPGCTLTMWRGEADILQPATVGKSRQHEMCFRTLAGRRARQNNRPQVQAGLRAFVCMSRIFGRSVSACLCTSGGNLLDAGIMAGR